MKRIMLLFGGQSSEHEVSLMGYEYVSSLMKDTEYEILPVYVDRDGVWHVGGKDGTAATLSKRHGGSLLTVHGYVSIDAAIPLLHGECGEDGRIQGALDQAGIPYIGADVVTSAVCIDKFYTKCIAASLGIPTLESVSFSHPTDTAEAFSLCAKRLGLPMFMKPRRLGSSVGAYPIYDKDDFLEYFPLAMQKGDNLVIAEGLLKDKREIECAFYEAQGVRLITPPGEILVDGFYGWQEKYKKETKIMPRADIDESTAELVHGYATELAETLSLRHLARIDFFLTKDGVIFNEVNTFPGFTSHSLYPRLLEESGIHPRDALCSFIEDALSC